VNRIIGILVIALSLAAGWLWTDFRQFGQASLGIAVDQVYEFPRGASAARLAEDFPAPGAWKSSLYWRLFARLDPRARRLQAGEYLIPAGTTPDGLLDILGSGKVLQHPVTLIEGWNFREMMQVLARHDTLVHELRGADGTEVMARLGRPGTHPEGRFLPDTYLFPRGASDVQVLARAMAAMDRELEKQWPQREEDLPLASPEDALILASIVEKETGLASERPRIAGVFIRRLRIGMKLQTDPTVIYGMGERFDGNLRRVDLREDTPYNTYVHKGLPPTPIAMPGREALHAVLHPAEGDSLYFVSRGDGSHHFSATLAEHNRAVRKYQLKR